MYDLQERRSCDAQLVSLIEVKQVKPRKANKSYWIFLKPLTSQSFKAPPDITLTELGKNTLHWSQPLLSNRWQKVVVEGKESDRYQ